MKKLYIKIIFGIIFVINICFSFSSDYYNVAVDSVVQINEHNIYRGVENKNSQGYTLFVPTKSESEWRIFTNKLATNVLLREYGSWSCEGAVKCARKRSYTEYKMINGEITTSVKQEIEYARTGSEYASFSGSNCETLNTGPGTRWTSCRPCGWFNVLWCCDWEYCAVNSANNEGSCTEGDNGSCCNWEDSCDSCRDKCAYKSNRNCWKNSESC